MNNKGQIFSVDLIISLIIMIVFLGAIIGITESKAYAEKEKAIYNNLLNKTDAGFVSLTNSFYSCDSNGLNLAFSIDKEKINGASETSLKQQMGLLDFNTYLEVDSTIIIDNSITGDFIVSMDKNILVCENGINRTDIINCINGSCVTEKKRVILRVSK